ncbi:DUF1906 domain-containing protein [Actinomadura spongiicola]|uniref:DUF1906 domain-containing protein n=1 Tax=Actinomadura spongiicola TaxID=2303421 RepID=A0A372GJP3_9ACTN|nr:DUF1906 domain-containing protein [Actinomadura spongiicola]RFS85581.1 DUF1906 domain-containing protein [Actinomadura spongiicola]
MRRAFLLPSAVLSGAVLATGPSVAAIAPPAHAAPRVVEYLGLRISVPVGWEVHRLDRDASRCVRFDRHVLYLGRPGPEPDCPPRLVGRTEALHIQPAERAGPSAEGRRASGKVVRADGLATLTIPPTVDHEARLTVPEAGAAITGVYGTDPAPLQRILRGTRLDPGRATGSGPPTPDPRRERPGNARGDLPPDPARPWTRGRGFDTCTAPSLATMRAWRPSFEVTNIYIGGAARGCAQPNLTEAWLGAVRDMGYRVTPTYVGLQAPCGSRRQRFTAKNAASQGAVAAEDAAVKAQALGIPQGAPIYYDMEAYDSRNIGCKAAVLRFVDNWVRRLTSLGYDPCLYSSVKSGIRDVGDADGISKPVAIWFAHWNGRADVYGDPFIPDHWWHPHGRIKQYRGGHKEKHGGVTLNIDSNVVDGRVL